MTAGGAAQILVLVGLGALIVCGQELNLPLLENQLGAQPRQVLTRPDPK
ncbi:hypothetical protein [Candidatus Chloroploca sp. Khr17]|nr:hypothetical protein [Candidatus Chloroploca sp. Khr17]